MTTSQILKEAKSLREGFKGNYFKALIVTTVIAVLYSFILFSVGFLLSIYTPNGILLSGFLDLLDSFLLTPLFIFPIQFGLTLLALDRAQNKPFELKRLFKPLNKKWRLFLFQYAVMLVIFVGILFTALFAIPTFLISKELLPAIAVGLIALLVPLYYLFTLSYFSALMIYKTDIKILEALKRSHRIVQANLKLIAWFASVVFLQVLASVLLLFIPLIWILPKVSIAYGLLYDRLCNPVQSEDLAEVTTI
tara:strand:+ start:478 stop:1227 length:750 start_codon:yes stop_codon:yes gene_type:complete